MVAVSSFAVNGEDTRALLGALCADIGNLAEVPDFVFVFYGCDHDSGEVHAALRRALPDVPFIGGTSCSGVMTERQLWDARTIAALVVCDPDGDYGVAMARSGDDASAAAEDALHRALENAGCPGELPELIWVFQAPGREEEVIAGLRKVVGEACPIIGGSAADNTVEGNWKQIGPEGVMSDGLVVGVLFTSGGIGFSFQGGYEPAGPSGVVTRIGFANGGTSGIVTKCSGREILEIDGAPAAATYNAWIGGLIADKVPQGGNILADTTMWPLAVDAGEIEGIPHYLLIHPDSVLNNGALTTFATIEEGSRIYSMRGDRDRLVERAGRVAEDASRGLPGGPESLAGGLVVYCAGCMLAVGEEMTRVADIVSESFAGQPFLGCFTFGEQGALVNRNVHGNLMISAIAFGQ
ncbi:MAG: FIST N-terminal domain-containing protein [Rhodospirillaceae bacterium]